MSDVPVRKRWQARLPWVVLALLVVWAIYVWSFPRAQLQDKIQLTGIGIIATAVTLLVWWLFLCGLPWRRRWILLAWPAGLLAVLAGVFRVDGVDGDLIPILRTRWSTRGMELKPAASAASSSESDIAAAEFPQFRGPGRDGILPALPLSRDWRAKPPTLLWRVNCGEGWAGYAVSQGLAITLEQREEMEVVICCKLLTGEVVWEHKEAARYENKLGGIGPRTTPAVAGGRVFAQGATGNLYCLDLKTGKHLWTTNVLTAAAQPVPDWGYSASPIVQNDMVITSPGGILALRVTDGTVAWSAQGASGPGYSSPRRVTLGGVDQFLVFNRETVAGHRATDGGLLWSFPWDKTSQHVADPQPTGPDSLLVSSGYGKGAGLLQLDPATPVEGLWTVTRTWSSMKLKAKMSNYIVMDGFTWGLNDGTLVCLDNTTGDRLWEGERYGHGQILAVRQALGPPLLVIMAENGDVVLMEAAGAGSAPPELGRITALEGKTWNPHTLAGRFLLVRNDAQAACFQLPVD